MLPISRCSGFVTISQFLLRGTLTVYRHGQSAGKPSFLSCRNMAADEVAKDASTQHFSV